MYNIVPVYNIYIYKCKYSQFHRIDASQLIDIIPKNIFKHIHSQSLLVKLYTPYYPNIPNNVFSLFNIPTKWWVLYSHRDGFKS